MFFTDRDSVLQVSVRLSKIGVQLSFLELRTTVTISLCNVYIDDLFRLPSVYSPSLSIQGFSFRNTYASIRPYHSLFIVSWTRRFLFYNRPCHVSIRVCGMGNIETENHQGYGICLRFLQGISCEPVETEYPKIVLGIRIYKREQWL